MCELLTMTVQFLITFSSFLFENKNFIAFDMRENFGNHLCTLDYRRTHSNLAVVVDEHHFFEFHFTAFVGLESVNK